MKAMFYKRKQISKLGYHCLPLELFKSLLFKVVLKSPDHFSNHSQTCDDGSLENSHTCSRKSEIWFRAELVALVYSFSSRPPVQVWTKNGNSPGVNFLSSDKDNNASFLPPLSFLDFLILAVSRYAGLLPQQLAQQGCNLNWVLQVFP